MGGSVNPVPLELLAVLDVLEVVVPPLPEVVLPCVLLVAVPPPCPEVEVPPFELEHAARRRDPMKNVEANFMAEPLPRLSRRERDHPRARAARARRLHRGRERVRRRSRRRAGGTTDVLRARSSRTPR
jgi:hypothetical protein